MVRQKRINLRMWKSLLILVTLVFPLQVIAQSVVTGNAFDNEERSRAIQGVTIKNLTTNSFVITNKDGHFAISAKAGDLISYGTVGYHTDTLYLINLFPKNLYLRVAVNTLNTVNITTTKISPFLDTKNPDAIAERQIGYSKNRGGLRLNLGYGKYRRQQAKVEELEHEDELQEEIAKNFTKEIIQKLVNYQGDDLTDYMDMYRPTSATIQNERPFNYEYYIATTFQEWKKLPQGARKLPSLYKSKK